MLAIARFDVVLKLHPNGRGDTEGYGSGVKASVKVYPLQYGHGSDR